MKKSDWENPFDKRQICVTVEVLLSPEEVEVLAELNPNSNSLSVAASTELAVLCKAHIRKKKRASMTFWQRLLQ